MTIVDYKTSKQLPTDQNDVPKDQITLYALAIKHDYSSKLDRIYAKVIYLHLQQEYIWEITEEDLAMTRHKYQTIIDSIQQKKDLWWRNQWLFQDHEVRLQDVFEPKQGEYCKRCDYQSLCPLFAHAYHEDEPIGVEVLQDQTVRWLTDRYAKLQEESKQLEKEKTIIGKLLVEFAGKKWIQKLYGNEYKIPVIARQSRVINPSREEEAIEKLKQIGEYDDVLSINQSKLAALIKKRCSDLQDASDLFMAKTTRYLHAPSRLKDKDRDNQDQS